MASSTIKSSLDISFTLTPELKQLVERLEKSQASISKAGGFSGKGGAALSNAATGKINAAKELSQKDSLTPAEWKIFKDSLRQASTALMAASKHVSGITEDLAKLQEQVQKKTEELSSLKDQKAAANSRKTSAYKAAVQGYSAFYNNKDGGVSKKPVSLSGDFYESLQNGTFKKWADTSGTAKTGISLYKNGQQVSIDSFLNSDNVRVFQEAVKEVNNFTKAIEKAAKEEDKLRLAESKQAEKDAKLGNTGAFDIVNQANANATSINRLTEIEEAAYEQEVFNAQLDLTPQKIEKQVSPLKKAFKQFTIYNTVIRLAKSALREASNTIKELDKSLTEQAMVTGKSREEVYGLLSQYQEMASGLGATTKEVSEATSEFIKQGKTISDSLTLAQAAVSAATVAGVSVGDSINYLTTALNGFKLSADEAMDVSDKFAAIAAASASDYDEIAIALSKVASQANLAGMSIDYTTALLTTGLEVTREAPETMGTALKTIIARMREISDYGETLEDGTDLNNVETQLNYVGIQLTNENGTLRDTEDVLNDLGAVWETLGTNQQAAIAKALAGTRQQSRLIAMMDNYDRVLQLQEVSQRSSGATAAQLSKYLDSFEASINRVQVAWEKVVTSFQNSDILMWIIDRGADILNSISNALGTVVGKVSVIGIIATALTKIVAQRIIENDLKKQEIKLQTEERKTQLETLQQQIIAKAQQDAINDGYREGNILQQKSADLIKQQNALTEEKIKLKKAESDAADAENEKKALELEKQELENLKTVKEKQAQAWKDTAEAAGKEKSELNVHEDSAAYMEASIKQVTADSEATKAENQVKELEVEIENVNNRIEQQKKTIQGCTEEQKKLTQGVKDQEAAVNAASKSLNNEEANIGKAAEEKAKKSDDYLKTQQELALITQEESKIFSNNATIVAFLTVKQRVLNSVKQIQNALASISTMKTTAETAAKKAEAKATDKQTIAQLKLNAAQKANVILTLIEAGLALITVITTIIEWSQTWRNHTERIADNIGELTNEIYELNQSNTAIQEGIDAWEEYDNKLIKTKEDLDSLEESLDGVADSLTEEQQEIYKNLSTEKRAEFLEGVLGSNNTSIKEKWSDVEKQLRSLSPSEREKMLGDLSKLSGTELESAGTIQAAVYAYNNQKLYDSIDKLSFSTQADKNKAETFAQSILENMSALDADNYRNHIDELSKIAAANVDQIEILEDTSEDLADRIAAYKEIQSTLTGSALTSFNSLYTEYEVFANLDDRVISLIDNLGLTTEQINNLYTAWENLNISEEEYTSRFEEMLSTFEETGDVAQTLKQVFGDLINEEDWNDWVNIFDSIAQSVLTIGQNMDNFTNKIENFYTKASKWTSMTQSEQAEFINDNAELFQGEDGKNLLNAFKTGDYSTIQSALEGNSALEKIRKQRITEVKIALSTERSRTGDDYNGALVAQYEEELKTLEDIESLYQASLDTRLTQEQSYLSQYKTYLQEQEEDLKDSLDKRKEAYQKYFDAVNENEDAEDYEEEANVLISNLSKLGSSTDAASLSTKADLEDQLEELEKERLKTLRENAQDAVLEDIDDQIDEISNKFDDLLNNSQELLLLMQADMSSSKSGFFSNVISSSISSGTNTTALEVQNFLATLQSTFGSMLDGVDLSDMKVEDTGSGLVLNVNGTTYQLDNSSQQSLYQTIMAALKQLGIK